MANDSLSDVEAGILVVRPDRDDPTWGPRVLSLALELAEQGVAGERATGELLVGADGRSDVLLEASSLGNALERMLPDDEHAARVVDLLTTALCAAQHERRRS